MTSCSILRKRIGSARTKKRRGKALGAYAKSCVKGKKRHRKH